MLIQILLLSLFYEFHRNLNMALFGKQQHNGEMKIEKRLSVVGSFF